MKRLAHIVLWIACLFAFSSPVIANTELWYSLRRNFKLQDQSSHPAVKQQIKWLLLHPNYLTALAKNSKPYIYFILEELKRQNLPGELALMPMIESNYNPFAYSHAGAAGLWQLMPGTGSGLGVKQNWWYDGRRGVISSTMAALDYITYLNKFFKGNWLHAIAAYDSGEGTVQRAIRKNQKNNQPIDFWSLHLPRETQAYLPRLLALASVIKYPRYFGATLPQQNYAPYFEAVPLEHQLDLNQAAKLAKIDYKEMLKLNPGHNRWTTAPSHINNTLLVPIDKVKGFLERLKTAPKIIRTAWARYKIKKGDSLSQIAQKNKSSIKAIQKINKLKSDTIRSGKTLLIPKTPTLSAQAALDAQQKIAAINRSGTVGRHKQLIHIVQKHDSLTVVAKHYGVKQAEIIFWNQLKTTTLAPEQKLLIWRKQYKSKGKFYTVKAGDCLSKIAAKHHLKLSTLKKLNTDLGPNATIKPKQRVRVY